MKTEKVELSVMVYTREAEVRVNEASDLETSLSNVGNPVSVTAKDIIT